MSSFLYQHSGKFLIFWIGIIFLLCSTPGQFFPSAGWMELLSLDKWVHAGVFFILCVLIYLYAFKNTQSKSTRWLFTLFAVIYGVALEFMQAHWFSNRSFDYLDMLANATGCVIALLAHSRLSVRFREWAK